MNTFLKFAVAAGIVLGCSIDAKAQGPIRGQVVGGPVINNTYNYGGGYGYRGNYTYNCVGCFPGAGPYDSTIATTAIAAGAGVLGAAIGALAAKPAQPQTVIIQNPTPVIVQPGISVNEPVYQSGPNCQIFISGYSPSGVPVYIRSCR